MWFLPHNVAFSFIDRVFQMSHFQVRTCQFCPRNGSAMSANKIKVWTLFATWLGKPKEIFYYFAIHWLNRGRWLPKNNIQWVELVVFKQNIKNKGISCYQWTNLVGLLFKYDKISGTSTNFGLLHKLWIDLCVSAVSELVRRCLVACATTYTYDDLLLIGPWKQIWLKSQ